MSHGSGLVRTTCSSGGAPGPGQPSEGLLDAVYPRTHGALLKVAQMVRRVEWPGDSYAGLHLAGTPGAPRAALVSPVSARKFLEQPAGSPTPSSLLQPPPYRARPLPHRNPGCKFLLAFLPLLQASRLAPGQGRESSPLSPAIPRPRPAAGEQKARLGFRISAGDGEKRRL